MAKNPPSLFIAHRRVVVNETTSSTRGVTYGIPASGSIALEERTSSQERVPGAGSIVHGNPGHDDGIGSPPGRALAATQSPACITLRAGSKGATPSVAIRRPRTAGAMDSVMPGNDGLRTNPHDGHLWRGKSP